MQDTERFFYYVLDKPIPAGVYYDYRRKERPKERETMKAKVAKLVKCDFCPQIADYDAKITRPAYNGMWANMCRLHWEDMTNQKLGLGLGQKLEKA